MGGEREIRIGDRNIGSGCPVYIVGEIGSNHCQDKGVVQKLIETAAETGFDAVKFQTYDPEDVFSQNVRTGDVRLDNLYGDRCWWDVARESLLMPRNWFEEMFTYAREKGLSVFSTVHSIEDARFIEQFSPPVFKIASIDVSHTEFLKSLSAFQKPLFLSTGLHSEEEIKNAVTAVLSSGNDQLVLLHCVSVYPPKPEDLNLRNIVMLRETFHHPVGFSDHSSDNRSVSAAVALGACVIEKHITLDRTSKGPDHHFALDPAGMEDLVERVRFTEKILGSYRRQLHTDEKEAGILVRRSVVARRNIRKGELFSPENLKLSRPGSGLHPKYYRELLGRKAKQDIVKESLLRWEDAE